MIMDIKAVCADKILNYRQVNIQADGRIHMVDEGVHFFPQLANGASEGNRLDVLCTLLLRAGESTMCRSTLLNALQLDELRER